MTMTLCSCVANSKSPRILIFTRSCAALQAADLELSGENIWRFASNVLLRASSAQLVSDTLILLDTLIQLSPFLLWSKNVTCPTQGHNWHFRCLDYSRRAHSTHSSPYQALNPINSYTKTALGKAITAFERCPKLSNHWTGAMSSQPLTNKWCLIALSQFPLAVK